MSLNVTATFALFFGPEEPRIINTFFILFVKTKMSNDKPTMMIMMIMIGIVIIRIKKKEKNKKNEE